jgi:hypothetical protein
VVIAKLTKMSDHGVRYQGLVFACPGCAEMREGSVGLHILPVNAPRLEKPSWDFDGNLEAPTLSPSILTRNGDGGVCHSFIQQGQFQFLGDCTHSMAGQTVPMPELPDWA